MISITTKIERKGDAKKVLEKIKAALKGPSMVKVGLPAGKAPGELIDIAFWNHEGTNRESGDVFFRNGKFGISGPIPPRPFIPIAMFKGRMEIRAHLRADAAKIVRGEMDMAAALPRLGLLGSGLIHKTVSAGVGPPNSPMTVELKGSSKPLIDNRRLIGAFTWAVDK